MALINHTTKAYTFRNYTLAIALGWVSLASCTEDPGPTSAADVPAIFTPFISETGVTGSGVQSRAANDSWDADDRVGIYMVSHVSETGTAVDLSTALSANIEYKTSSGGTSSELVAVNNPIFYPYTGDAVNFLAYYPYSGDIHGTNNHIYKVKVSDQSNLPAIDLLYHNGVGTAYSHSSTVVELSFKHQLSKLLIQVIPASEDVNVDLTGTTASLVGFPTTADFNLGSGVLSNPGNAATEDTPINLVLKTANSSASRASFEAIVVPIMTGDTFTRTIRFEIGGESYSYTLPQTTTLQSGRAYSYNFKFTGEKVVLVQNTIVGWDGGTVAWGDYLLTASKMYFDDLPYTPSTGHTVTLATNAPSAPVISYSAEGNNASNNPPTWMHTSLSPGATDENGLTKYTLSFDVDLNNDTKIRTVYIQLEVDGLMLVIRVIQDVEPIPVPDNEANCFMITPGGAGITFNPIRAIRYGGATPTAKFTVKKLWDDTGAVRHVKIDNAVGADAVITVAPTSTAGNAVIAVYEGETIVWSYHIWVVDYDPETVYWENNGFTVMDRNLGATKASMGYGLGTGLFYQWGRKDPFPAVDEVAEGEWTIAERASFGTVTTTTAIQNPNTFITTDTYDWLTKANTKLWGQDNTLKTQWDPCPAGWKTPYYTALSDSPWFAITHTQHWESTGPGINRDVHCLIPAAGQRFPKSGLIQYNANAYLWGDVYHSSGGTSCCTWFNQSTVENLGRSNAWGIPIRCVRLTK